MKKIYLSLVLSGFCFTAIYAQKQQAPAALGEAHTIVSKGFAQEATSPEKAIIWTEDFAGIGTSPNPTLGPNFTTANGTWTTGGANGNIWKHSFFTTSGEWSGGTAAFGSTTAGNGFMLFDADSVNFPISPSYMNYTGELISPSIDLTTATSALLSIEQDFRFCCAGAHSLTVSVSTNGGGTWGTPYDLVGGTAVNADYFGSNGGDYKMYANISGQAVGFNVMLKFTWDGVGAGVSHYYWTIDDLVIEDLPADDIQLLASWISGENNSGMEYGRTPQNQQDANYYVGGQVYNFGSNDQTNIIMTANFGAFSSVGNDPLLEADSTVILEQTEALSLTPAVYLGNYSAVSDLETGGANFGNNTGGREFEITQPTGSAPGVAGSIYSQDGIGVYTTNVLIGGIGTASFTGGEDGLVLAAYYHVKQTMEVCGIRGMLSPTGNVAGGEVYGSIKDTATFWANDMTSLFNTNPATVSAANISAGYVDLLFPTAITLNPGIYYAALELYSNTNANNIRIRDDQTVPQPVDASAIYIPGDQSYTNGEALAIRMLTGLCTNEIEEQVLVGVSVFPNPSEGVFTVSNDNGDVNVIVIHDLNGKVIYSTEAKGVATIDLSANASGIYVLEVTNVNGTMTERIAIK